MKKIEYKVFSARIHRKNWLKKIANTCRFELTYRCQLNCKQCYTSCYNHDKYLADELSTESIKRVLNGIYEAGALWICFSGGDPFMREDFLEIYKHAKRKGFLITIFTNGCSVTDEAIKVFKKSPPFAIEITLNAVSEDLYEQITQVEGAFNKAMAGIDLILKAGIPLKLKTVITRDNLKEWPNIRRFTDRLGVKLLTSPILNARLDGDTDPCSLRIQPKDFLNLEKDARKPLPDIKSQDNFSCSILTRPTIIIDPYGNMVPCCMLRELRFSLLEDYSVKDALKKSVSYLGKMNIVMPLKCKRCTIKRFCFACPGMAQLETRDMSKSIDYFCRVAHVLAGENRI